MDLDLTIGEASEQEPRDVYRLKTSCWHDGRSLHVKRSLTRLKRLSFGADFLNEEVLQVGAEELVSMICNLSECEDGVYVVVFVEGYRDYETGHLEDWEYKLVPYIPDQPSN